MFKHRQPAPGVFPLKRQASAAVTREQKWGKYRDDMMRRFGGTRGGRVCHGVYGWLGKASGGLRAQGMVWGGVTQEFRATREECRATAADGRVAECQLCRAAGGATGIAAQAGGGATRHYFRFRICVQGDNRMVRQVGQARLAGAGWKDQTKRFMAGHLDLRKAA